MAVGNTPPYTRRDSALQPTTFGLNKAPVARQAAVPAATGGTATPATDAEARAAIALLIARLQAFGLIV